MDLGYFVNILMRRKWLILSVVLLSATAAWFLVGKLPPVFKSSAIVSTGIVQYKGKTLSPTNGFIQQYEIDGAFNQLMNDMTLREVMRGLTDALMAHEYQKIGLNTAPFRQPNYDDLGMSADQVTDIANAFLVGNDSLEQEQLSLKNRRKLEAALGYDYESLIENLEIKRKGDTDYLEIAFTSENRDLSYFALTTYLDNFIKYYGNNLSSKERKSVNFYTDQVKIKKDLLDSLLVAINIYRDANNIISVETQSEAIIAQKSDFEKRRNEEEAKIIPLKASIKALGSKILDYNRTYSEYISSDIDNRRDMIDMNEQIAKVQEKLLTAKGERKKRYQKRLRELRNVKASLIADFVAKNTRDNNPVHEQVKGWISKKLDKEIELEFAEEAVSKYNKEIALLNGQLSGYQEDDKVLRGLEEEKEIAQSEYIAAKGDLEEANLAAEGTENPITIVEPAEKPELPEASLRPIIAAFSGIAGGTLTSILIFFLAFFDTTVQSPAQYKKQTNLPFLGYVNKIKLATLNLYYLFHTPNPVKDLIHFRESIRKIRSAIENSGQQSFLLVSPKSGEGKSFLTILIAYALSLNNKKVLIIDTNFRNNTLSNFKDSPNWVLNGNAKNGVFGTLGSHQKLLGTKAEDSTGEFVLKNIDIISNKQSMQSPSEVLAGKNFEKIIANYKFQYDYIFLEAAAMNEYSDAAELIPFVDKVIGVFSSESPFGSVDEETMVTLRQLHNQFLGGVLNNVDLKNI